VQDYPVVPGRAIASPVLVAELEKGYEALYLTVPGSLQRSHDLGQSPPRNDSFVKICNAMAQSPTRVIGLLNEQERVDSYRHFGRELISLDNDDEFFAWAA